MKKGWGGGGERCWTLTLKTPPWVVTLIKSYGTTKLSVSASGVRSGGGQQSRTTLFLLGPSLVHLCRIQISHQQLLRNEQPLGSVCLLLRKTKKSCQKGNTTQRRQRWSRRQGRSLHDGGLTGNGGLVIGIAVLPASRCLLLPSATEPREGLW